MRKPKNVKAFKAAAISHQKFRNSYMLGKYPSSRSLSGAIL